MTCPCHSGKKYEVCCALYHKGKACPNAQLLMRSRYSAYAMGNVDYILKTTHPQHRDKNLPIKQQQEQIEAFCKQTRFKGLDILDFEEGDPYSFVTFRASLSQEGKDVSFTEKSQFEKVNNEWFYLSGEIKI